MNSLHELALNRKAEILAIEDDPLSPKLADMGLFPGKQVQVLFRAPLGDPIAVDVEGYSLALRKKEAALIQVEALP